MRSLAYPLAVLLVLAVPLLVVVGAAAFLRWARWLLAVGGGIGIAGVVLVTAATVNLFVPRTCGPGGGPAAVPADVNRPIISLALDGGGCFNRAAAQAGLGPLAAAVTTAAALIRRSACADSGAAPVAPHL